MFITHVRIASTAFKTSSALQVSTPRRASRFYFSRSGSVCLLHLVHTCIPTSFTHPHLLLAFACAGIAFARVARCFWQSSHRASLHAHRDHAIPCECQVMPLTLAKSRTAAVNIANKAALAFAFCSCNSSAAIQQSIACLSLRTFMAPLALLVRQRYPRRTTHDAMLREVHTRSQNGSARTPIHAACRYMAEHLSVHRS